MTADEFIAKFPEQDTVNENCLRELACPKCGSRGDFKICVVSTATVSDDGTEDFEGSDWDETSWCHCRQCGNRATVLDFTIEDLDEKLDQIIKGRLRAEMSPQPRMLGIFIPRNNSLPLIKSGSAIVGTYDEYGGLTIDFEGNLYGAENLKTYEQRLIVAAGRHAHNYPTVARMSFWLPTPIGRSSRSERSITTS